jgi:hypothetical protein
MLGCCCCKHMVMGCAAYLQTQRRVTGTFERRSYQASLPSLKGLPISVAAVPLFAGHQAYCGLQLALLLLLLLESPGA